MKKIFLSLTLLFATQVFAGEVRLMELNVKSMDQHCREYPAYVVQTGKFNSMRECLRAKALSDQYLLTNSPEMIGNVVSDCEPDSTKLEKDILSEMENKYISNQDQTLYRPSAPVEYEVINGFKSIVGECTL